MFMHGGGLPEKAKLLLITAHPDDECMFFLPSIKSYLKRGTEVHILCLSTGVFMSQEHNTLVQKSARSFTHRFYATIVVTFASAGNADGLGHLRSQELLHACSLINIGGSFVTIVDDPVLPDGMRESWPMSNVARHVTSAIRIIMPSLVSSVLKRRSV